jgi:type I restriction enzyme S subunit
VLRTVQRAREACERVLAATRQLKQSLLHHLFTYGPVPVPQAAHVPLKETEIGEMPEHWACEPLGNHVQLLRNGLTKTQNRDGRGLPVTRIETISEDSVNPAKVGYIEAVTDEEIAKYRLQKHDILFSHINSEPQLGRTAMYLGEPETLLHGMNLLMLRAASSVDPFFLHLACTNLRRKGVFIGIASRAVGQSSINQGRLRAVLIPIPPLSEQREIARQLGAVDAKIAALEKRRAALDALFRSLLEHLMTGRLRLPEFAR